MARSPFKGRPGGDARKFETSAAPKGAPPITLDHLPPDVTRHRILNTAEAAQFCRISVAHWRRLYRVGKVPAPVRLSTRKYGWRVGDLVDFIDARAA